ncbi:unnamed protein product [Arctogadus glacialis]
MDDKPDSCVADTRRPKWPPPHATLRERRLLRHGRRRHALSVSHCEDDGDAFAPDVSRNVNQSLFRTVSSRAEVEEWGGDEVEEWGGDEVEEWGGDEVEEWGGDEVEEWGGDEVEEWSS